MGDRGTIVLQIASDDRVCLYTHWRGSELPAILTRALANKKRWDDGPYLARIVFCEMVKGHENGETGFGISQNSVDGLTLVVDLMTQTVCKGDPDSGAPIENAARLSFEEYAALIHADS